MWWAGKRAAARATAIAYVGEGAVRLALGGTLLLATEVHGREEAFAALQAAVRELPRGTRLRVAVGGAFCRPWVMPHVDGAAGDSDWTAIAAALVEDSTGLPADSRVWMDEAQAAPRLAVAMDAACLRRIEAIGGQALESVRPWWAMAIDAMEGTRPTAEARAGRHGLAVADSEDLVLLLAEGGTYQVAQTYALDGDAPAAVLSRALVTHDGPAAGVRLVEFDSDALVGQGVGDHLPFSKGVAA